jgi:hypothetical protein
MNFVLNLQRNITVTFSENIAGHIISYYIFQENSCFSLTSFLGSIFHLFIQPEVLTCKYTLDSARSWKLQRLKSNNNNNNNNNNAFLPLI